MRCLIALLAAAVCVPAPTPKPCPTPEGLSDECPELITAKGQVFGALEPGEIDVWEVGNTGDVETTASVGF